MVERNYIDMSVKICMGKTLNTCACHLNKMDKHFSDYEGLTSSKLSEFFGCVYERLIDDVPTMEMREMTKTTSLSTLAYYIYNKQYII